MVQLCLGALDMAQRLLSTNISFSKSWLSFSPIIVCILMNCMLPFRAFRDCPCSFVLALIINVRAVTFFTI